MTKKAKAKAEYGMAILDALADKWAAEVDLTSMMMEVQIDAIARQAFIEGAMRAIFGLQDERKEMRRRGIKKRDVDRAADQIGK